MFAASVTALTYMTVFVNFLPLGAAPEAYMTITGIPGASWGNSAADPTVFSTTAINNLAGWNGKGTANDYIFW